MIWIKVAISESKRGCVFLPQNIASELPSHAKLRFGLKEKSIDIISEGMDIPQGDNSFNNPITIGCSRDVIEDLIINKDMIYQMVYSEQLLKIGPVIGLLLGEQQSCYNDRNMDGFTRGMGIYSKIGGLIIAFKELSIDWERNIINGLYFNYNSNKWCYGASPIPSAIFRRAFQINQNTIDKLKTLTENNVFNSTRFDKWQIYNLLKNAENFKIYLPDTEKLSNEESFNRFISKHSKIILKPAGLSRGRGICFVKRNGTKYLIYDYRNSNIPRFHVIKEELMNSFLVENNLINKDYIMQQQLELANINGAPFDIRVVIGKDPDKSWNCRGIECRLAGPKNIITNISRGGQALSINNAVTLAFGPMKDARKIRDEIIAIAKKFCSEMDSTGEHFVEFGLDLAIDPKGNYWFIEANVRPVFRGFKKLNYDNYLHIRHMPLIYAASAAGFGKEAEKSELKV